MLLGWGKVVVVEYGFGCERVVSYGKSLIVDNVGMWVGRLWIC